MTDRTETPFAANDVRLTPREWLIALAVTGAILVAVPIAWQRVEPLDITPNHRMPYALGYDYWTYDRMCRAVCAEGDDQERNPEVLIVGDSVVWGHYVAADETLSAQLNGAAGGERFANLGVDGIHPAALAGLMEHYGRAIADRDVILHCNFLWMSSARRDLQSTKEFALNHADLVPQFIGRPPCYRAKASKRLGVVVGRYMPAFQWANHMQIAYLDGADLAAWSIDHPYDNPVDALSGDLPSPYDSPASASEARPWQVRGLSRFNPPWVKLDESFQWRCFTETLEALRGRGNRVFVVVGPLNEDMLTEASLATYTTLKAAARAWLREREVPHYAASALPSEMYADTSHPLAEGYRRLAEALARDEAFREFLDSREARR